MRLSERQDEVLADLEIIFLEEGFKTITIAELAARTKCSKRTLYDIAPSKQDLVILVMTRWLSRIRHLGWTGALEHDDPVKRVEAYLSPGVSESRRASSQFLEDVQASTTARTMLEAHQKERTQVLKDILADGVRRGRFRRLNPALVAEVFLASVGRINEPALLDETRLGFSEAFSEFFQLILHGIVKDDTKAAARKS